MKAQDICILNASKLVEIAIFLSLMLARGIGVFTWSWIFVIPISIFLSIHAAALFMNILLTIRYHYNNSQYYFLLSVLQATSESQCDPRIVYLLLSENLEQLNDNFAQVLRIFVL